MLKKTFDTLCVTAVVATLSILASNPAQAASFTLQFDNTFDDSLTPPITGTGTLSYAGAIQTGTFSLDTLTNLSLNFTVNGQAFNLGDLAGSSLSSASLVVQTTAGGYQAYFAGGPNGVYFGSLDFQNGQQTGFTFQPSYYSPPPLHLYQEPGTPYKGTYTATATAVPEPAMFLGVAAVGLGGVALKRQRKLAPSANL
ncbi:hypothetical protein BST81_05355 [Leptolyngbya sp. 'hensonii']|uniref:PEP-CTERM sorting domain-containing protein n=1 Tax=Leptolyngbya sp. 'hensonii' TaxID=1922337 RepID=UPI00094F7A9B|nr:PEP-CTERM sorting domain-containing protein [Leptolyngbya sp. 'hensonii']OLP19454.1 hypothetical protein BST81_05355 [Leptolyngbya sp. 'hensonii']